MADTKTKKRNKRKRRVSITEEAVSLLLQRYSPETIITLLQEVAHNADVKMDWNQLVKNTSTGITNAREYQMIWRHLAYQHPFSQHDLDDQHQPLDDDSDLETKLEAFPPVSREVSVEAAAYAKVLLGSDLPSDSGSLNCSTVEAPLTINIPTTRAFPVDLDNPQLDHTQGKNIIVPVSVSFPTTEVLEGNKSATGPSKKRKTWTEEEDKELIAAVQKWGERNWTNIIKDNIKSDRTASQLSQRWAILRKYRHNLHSDATTETLLATRRAFSHALGMPMEDNLLTACTGGVAQSSRAAVPSGFQDTSLGSLIEQPPHHKGTLNVMSKFRKDPQTGAVQSNTPLCFTVASGPEDISGGSQTIQYPHCKGTSSTLSKSKVTTVAAKKGTPVPFKPPSRPNSMIHATAIAAGARIATPSVAASMLKAAQSKSAVRIRPGGSSMVKTAISSITKSSPTDHVRFHHNVNYFQTGLAPGSTLLTCTEPSPSPSTMQEAAKSKRPEPMASSLPLNTESATVSTLQMGATPISCASVCDFDEGKTAGNHNYGYWSLI